MDRDELVRKVCAMLANYEDVAEDLRQIKTHEDLSGFLESFSKTNPLDSEEAKKFLTLLKDKRVFKVHFPLLGMEKVWRNWAREQGIKEGHFLFEN